MVEAEEFSCDQCDLSFKYIKNLKLHKSIKHSHKTANYKCEACGKDFLLKGSLTRHKKTHTTENLQ